VAARLAAVVLVALAVGGSWAEEGAELVVAPMPAVATARAAAEPPPQQRFVPWVHPAMPEAVRARLESGFALALDRLRDLPACRGLFERLGADPFATLATGLYFPVDSYRREVEVCGRNLAASSRGAENLAYTTVGGAPTFLCRHFARVSTETAAVAVIHEALHHAGLTEWPADRLAMTSAEITALVETACGF
jgi:hypothetical protein